MVGLLLLFAEHDCYGMNRVLLYWPLLILMDVAIICNSLFIVLIIVTISWFSVLRIITVIE